MNTNRRHRSCPPSTTATALVGASVLVVSAIVASTVGCNKAPPPEVRARATRPQPAEPAPRPHDPTEAARERMVKRQLAARDIHDKAVLAAMRKVPRHMFVPQGLRDSAYSDFPLPIGHRQTISQPYIVALMTQLAGAAKGKRALDVGTGSGYQAAVLAEIGARVHSVEIVCPLAKRARQTLDKAGYNAVVTRCGDGYRGWPEHAPFDVIILAAAPDHVPQPLIDQLAPGGALVLPVGPRAVQKMVVIRKDASGRVSKTETIAVRFVPMTGEAEKGPR